MQAFEQTCAEHRVVREDAEQRLQARRVLVRDVAQRCVVKGDTAPGQTRLVAAQWLQAWANELAVPEMDNTSLMCEHGGLHHAHCLGTDV